MNGRRLVIARGFGKWRQMISFPTFLWGGGVTYLGSRNVQDNKGTINHGERHATYCFAHYSDVFKHHKSFSDSRSVADCYSLRLGIYTHPRISGAEALSLPLTQHGQQLNNGLSLVLNDILQGLSMVL